MGFWFCHIKTVIIIWNMVYITGVYRGVQGVHYRGVQGVYYRGTDFKIVPPSQWIIRKKKGGGGNGWGRGRERMGRRR